MVDHSTPHTSPARLTLLDELEDALAVAAYRRRVADGTAAFVPHDEVRRRLGLDSPPPDDE